MMLEVGCARSLFSTARLGGLSCPLVTRTVIRLSVGVNLLSEYCASVVVEAGVYGIASRTGVLFDILEVPFWLGRRVLAAVEHPSGVFAIDGPAEPVWQFLVAPGRPFIGDLPRDSHAPRFGRAPRRLGHLHVRMSSASWFGVPHPLDSRHRRCDPDHRRCRVPYRTRTVVSR